MISSEQRDLALELSVEALLDAFAGRLVGIGGIDRPRRLVHIAVEIQKLRVAAILQAIVIDGQAPALPERLAHGRKDILVGRAPVGPVRGRGLRAGQKCRRAVAVEGDRKSTRLNSSHYCATRMPSSA